MFTTAPGVQFYSGNFLGEQLIAVRPQCKRLVAFAWQGAYHFCTPSVTLNLPSFLLPLLCRSRQPARQGRGAMLQTRLAVLLITQLPLSCHRSAADGSLRGKGGAAYPKHAGLCLETQGFPNAINTPSFPSGVPFRGAGGSREGLKWVDAERQRKGCRAGRRAAAQLLLATQQAAAWVGGHELMLTCGALVPPFC